jgi:predicted Zn-dependent protease
MKRIINRTVFRQWLAILAVGLLAACETVQTTQGGAIGIDRQQRMAVSSAEIDQAAGQQYSELIAEARRKGVLNQNAAQVSRVRAIANRLIPQTTVFRPDARSWNWEVNVLSSPEVNAWCMPGGKIAVYTGLLDKLHPTDDELAAVLGHEIAHALREHARERVSEQTVANGMISIGAALLGLGDTAQKGAQALYMGAMGLPHSRQQETEADRIGVELAARASYDPRAAITLWKKMGQVAGSEPLPFLSTHPSREDRMNDLAVYSQRVVPLYEQAKKSR